MKNLPTDDQRLKYAEFVEAWQNMLGMTDWHIAHSGANAPKAMGDVTVLLADRQAHFRLGDFKSSAINDDTLEALAVHELLHVLLAPLINVASNPEANADHLKSVEHSVINTLQRLLVPN